MVPPPYLRKLSLWIACASAIAILLGISVSQILLAVGLGVLLLSGLPLRVPRIALPLGLFLLWTLVALAVSPDPAGGLDQVRKMFVFLTLLVVFSSVRSLRAAGWLTFGWMAVGTLTAARGVVQFARDVAGARAAHEDLYHYYIADRIRGFMSHWMTFSGQEMFVLLLLAAFLLFAPAKGKRFWLAIPGALIVGLALVLSDTRGVWIAAVVAGFYLLWCWRKWAAAVMPVVLALGLLVAPASIQKRAKSIFGGEKQTDSNDHRIICWRTGWQMIKAHPLTGVGPDEIRKEKVFFAYMPADIPLPLPPGFYEHLHNIYIQYAAERGIPATLFITAAMVMALWDFHRALRRLPPGRSEARFLLQAASACVIGTMVGGVAEYNLNDSEVLALFLALMCIGYLAVSPKEMAA